MQTKTITLDYMPTAKQLAFHSSHADEVLFGGAAGGGKSIAVVMDALNRCLKTPGAVAYLFRRTYRELDDTLVAAARRMIPDGLGEYRSSHDFELVNGSVMRFRHCQHDKDRYKYQGAEIHFLYIDELTHFSRTIFDYLKSRLRANVALGIRPLVRCTANPGGFGHVWVKHYFVDGGSDGVHIHEIYSDMLQKTQKRSIQYIPANVMDNPHIGEDYIFELEQKPRILRNALLHGLWDAFEGQVFAEWANVESAYATHKYTHVISPFELPSHWPRYRSFDFGYAKPFSVLWWAVGEDGGVYLYREWYGASAPNAGLKMTAADIARGILARESGESISDAFADPSIWDGSRGESIVRQMEREGVYFQPGENSRLAGKMQMHLRLAFDENGYAGLRVFSNCKEFIRCIPALTYDERRPEDVDSNGEDHCYDAARYFLMYKRLGVRPKPKVRRVFDPLDDGGRHWREGFLQS